MHIVLGIGNPGAEYVGTRHNVGFDVIDELARRAGAADFDRHKKWRCRHARARLPGGDVLLVKPQTYVNRSGACAQAVLAFYKIPPARMLVVVDDIHLALGTLRLRAAGSSGGHNGLRDIEDRIGRDYPRLRLGIGAPRGDQVGHVLGRFAPAEREDAAAMLDKAADCAALWLAEGPAVAMRCNGPLRPPSRPPAPAEADDAPAADG